MKKLMYLWVEDDDLRGSILKEDGVAFSESLESFICFAETCNKLSSKYHFDAVRENAGFMASDLVDFLETQWEETDEYATLHSLFNDELQHHLSGDAEIGLEQYHDEKYDNYEENVKELFSSKDWYKKILRDTRIEIISLITDSIVSDAKEQIKALESEI